MVVLAVMRCRRGRHATVFCGPIRMAGNRGQDGVVFLESVLFTGRSGEMADATDSKSVVRKDVWVQVPPPVLMKNSGFRSSGHSICRNGRLRVIYCVII